MQNVVIIWEFCDAITTTELHVWYGMYNYE